MAVIVLISATESSELCCVSYSARVSSVWESLTGGSDNASIALLLLPLVH